MLLTSQMDFVVVVQPLSCVRLCNPMDCSTSEFPVLHHLPELAQTHVRWVDDAIQPSCPLSLPSPPAINLSQHQSLFQWVRSLQQVVKNWSFSISPSNEYWELISFRGGSREELPHVWGQGQWPGGATPMFKVNRGSDEEIPLVQGKEQHLHFAGAAMKRYPMIKVRETQVRW